MSLKGAIYRLLPSSVKERLDENYRQKQLKVDFFEEYKKYIESNGSHNIYYDLFLKAFCDSSGGLFEDLHQKIISESEPRNFEESEGVLGLMTSGKVQKIKTELNSDGYSIFKEKLPSEMREKIIDFALKQKSYIPRDSNGLIFDENYPKAEIYRFLPEDLMENEVIQSLVMDPTLISVAREYLGCEPIFDFPAMWWSPTFNKESSGEAAQKYHFDLDRVKWLKIFIYLFDVGPENGPHYYVKGTHKVGVKTKQLLSRGYTRIPDEDIYSAHGKENEKVILGEAGSIFAGDTMCWHKGSAVLSGKRLVLEFQFTSSCFGSSIPSYMVKNTIPEFKDFVKANPFYTQRIKFA